MDQKYDFAVFPGDFNPFHYGHLDVLAKASRYVDKILLFVIDISDERRTVTPPPFLDLNRKHTIIKRYISEGYFGDVGAQCELHSGEEEFDEFYLKKRYTLICGSDIFNFTRFSVDDPQYEEFGWLIENCRSRIILVVRPGFAPDSTILSQVASRGIDVDILKGESPVSARTIRNHIATGKAITGMVPPEFEKDVFETYRKLL